MKLKFLKAQLKKNLMMNRLNKNKNKFLEDKGKRVSRKRPCRK